MKKLTVLSGVMMITGVLTFLSQASGQAITITNNDLPSAGLKVVIDSDGTSKPSPGIPSLTAQNWDFSGLQRTKPKTVAFMNPGQTPYSSTFSAANLADSTYGGNGYNFFVTNSSLFSVEGSEEIINFTYNSTNYTFQVEINLNPMFEQSGLPATYSDHIMGVASGSETFNKTIIISSFLTVTQEKTTTTITYSDTVDAFGTMKMPNGKNYPVLRQKHDEVDVDSVNGYVTGYGWVNIERLVTKKYQYDWYAQGVGYILAEMDMDSTSSTIKDIIWDTTAPAPAGINEISNSGKTLVYPNPCGSQINFLSTDKTEQYLSVYDVTGRQLDRVVMKNGMTTLNTSMYSNGVYFYQQTDKSGALADRGKFTVQR